MDVTVFIQICEGLPMWISAPQMANLRIHDLLPSSRDVVVVLLKRVPVLLRFS